MVRKYSFFVSLRILFRGLCYFRTVFGLVLISDKVLFDFLLSFYYLQYSPVYSLNLFESLIHCLDTFLNIYFLFC